VKPVVQPSRCNGEFAGIESCPITAITRLWRAVVSWGSLPIRDYKDNNLATATKIKARERVMNNIKIEAVIKIPETLRDSVSKSDVEEWIKYNMQYSCEMSGYNPLSNYDMETNDIDIYFD